jgi:chemotaxis protein methyltransferase CheR
MDIIFCRNVLMYFAPEQAKKVVRNLYDSLAEGGWLIVGLGETSHLLFSDYKMVQFPNAILYQKCREQKGRTHLPLIEDHRPVTNTSYTATPYASPQPVPQRQLPAERAAMLPTPLQNEGFPSSQETIEIAQSPLVSSLVSSSQALYKQGRYVEAEDQGHIELSEAPDEAGTLLLLARLHANQGKLDEALAWCRRSLVAERLNPSGHYLCATIQEARGEIEEAKESLRRVLYIHPEFVLAHFALGYLARSQGKKREADKHFANMLRLLRAYREDEILPESDGLTAGELLEMMRSTSLTEKSK